MPFSKRQFLASAALTVLASMAPAVHAATDKPITIVVGSPAGGTTDALARLIARSMGETLQRSVVVDNKPGAAAISLPSMLRAARRTAPRC